MEQDKKDSHIDEVLERAKGILREIRDETFQDLDNGGEGCGHRVVNGAKHTVDSIVDGCPMHIPQKSKVQLLAD